jgi:hypothetical protein
VRADAHHHHAPYERERAGRVVVRLTRGSALGRGLGNVTRAGSVGDWG